MVVSADTSANGTGPQVRYLILFSIIAMAAAQAEELPYASFAHPPVITMPSLSPDGSNIAAVMNDENGPVAVVGGFGGGEFNAIFRLKHSELRIDALDWASNETLVVTVSKFVPFRLIIWAWRSERSRAYYTIDKDGDEIRPLSIRMNKQASSNSRLLSTLPADPDNVLMAVPTREDRNYSVVKVGVADGDIDKLFANTYDIGYWWADDLGEVRFGLGYDRRTEHIVSWFRPDANSDWLPFHTRIPYVGESFEPVMVDGDHAIVLSDFKLNREAMWRYDISSKSFEELLFAVEGLDVAGAIYSPDKTRVVGAYYYDDVRREHYFSDADAERAEGTRELLPAISAEIVSQSISGTRIIVRADSDSAPSRYFWMDLETGAVGLIASQFPKLEGVELPGKIRIDFDARDGVAISGYLTLPRGANAEKPPLVVLVKDGPATRTTKTFDPIVQFLANRGLAVLEVNHRGSSGFGTEFRESGYRQWGQAMQHDIYDAIDWVAEQGLVDSGRKCMIGWGFGGYAALVAAYQEPDEFRCISSIAGISDLEERADLAITARPGYAFRRIMKERIANEIGDPYDSDDEQMLRANSPHLHVDKMTLPILLLHGTHDVNIDVRQSRTFFRNADAAGVDIKFIELDEGTHAIDGYENRMRLFEALDGFLKRHLLR